MTSFNVDKNMNNNDDIKTNSYKIKLREIKANVCGFNE